MKMLFSRFQYRSCDEQGQAFVGMAIVLPFFLFLIIGFIEISRALDQHTNMLRVARDATRYAVKLAGVQGNITCTSTLLGYTCPTSTHATVHALAQSTAQYLFQDVDPNSIVFSSRLNSSSANPAIDRTFVFEIRADYVPLLAFPGGNIPIKARVVGGYQEQVESVATAGENELIVLTGLPTIISGAGFKVGMHGTKTGH
ncbi:MAG: pilus assembly protein [Bdellovibrionales bacterium]|nr:pilus assembly protein [Bdellovibrionales bacterium]